MGAQVREEPRQARHILTCFYMRFCPPRAFSQPMWGAHVFLVACFAGIGPQLPANAESFVEVQQAAQQTPLLIRREQVQEAHGQAPGEDEMEEPVIETRTGPTVP